MGPAERRKELLKILCRRRFEQIFNLAMEFGVSERTIRRDIEVLSLTEPIYTQAGRYGGGVYVVDGYSINQLYATESEILVLKKLYSIAKNQEVCILSQNELNTLNNILENFSKPKNNRKKEK